MVGKCLAVALFPQARSAFIFFPVVQIVSARTENAKGLAIPLSAPAAQELSPRDGTQGQDKDQPERKTTQCSSRGRHHLCRFQLFCTNTIAVFLGGMIAI